MIGTGAAIAADGKFGDALRRSIKEREFKHLVETGTYNGQGSTRLISEAKSKGSLFQSIEICPALHQEARALNLDCELMLGLSVPRAMLPPARIIDLDVWEARSEEMDVDPVPGQEAAFYMSEVGYPGPDCLLERCVLDGSHPDFVMLDSAGHLGYYEFLYLMSMVSKSFVLALDDIRHLKHYRSFAWIQADDRFKILESDMVERHGFCIAEWRPK